MAGQTQLAALGLQDEYFSGTPQMSFFNKIFTKSSPFFIKSKEIPFNGTIVAFNNSHVCEIKKDGDIIRYIIVKIILPSMFKEGIGKSYPVTTTNFRPIIYYLDSADNVVTTKQAKNSVLYYNTLNTSWLPDGITIVNDSFQFEQFSAAVTQIGFKNTTDALFWGFKNEREFKNGFYLYDFSSTSQLGLVNCGWVNSPFPYFRYYNKNTGTTLVQRVELYVGGQLIESIPSEYINLNNQINVTNSQQDSLSFLLGTGQLPSTSDVEYFIKIPFSTKDISISSLERQNLEVYVYTNSFLEVVNSNGYNITTTNNITNYSTSVVSAFTDGLYDYVITPTSIRKYLSNLSSHVITNFTLSGVFGNFALCGSNISSLNISNPSNPILISYSTTSNTLQSVEISNCLNVSKSTGLVGSSSTQLFNYTPDQTVERVVTPLQRLSFPYSPVSCVYTYNNYSIVVVDDRIIVQSLVSPYSISDPIISSFGKPLKFSHGLYDPTSANYNKLFFITPTSLVEFNPLTTQQTLNRSWSSTANPTHLAVHSSFIFVVFRSATMNVYPSSRIVTLNGKITDIATSKRVNSVYLTYESGGSTLYTFSSTIDFYSSIINSSNLYSNIIVGSSFNYLYSHTSKEITQIENSSSWDVSVFKDTVSTTISGTAFFAFDNNQRIYYTGSDNLQLFWRSDSSNFKNSPEQIVQRTTTISGLSNIYYDGNYIYSFPTTGGSNVYRYNTTYDIFSPSAHQYVTIFDINNNPQQIRSGTVCSTSTEILSFPLKEDANIIVYNTTLPFDNPTLSFTLYDISSVLNIGKFDYTKSAIYKDRVIFASASAINRYKTNNLGSSITTPQNPLGLYAGETGVFNAGSAYNGVNTTYIFTSNLSANGIFKTTTNGFQLLTSRINSGISEFGKYRTVVPVNDNRTVYIIPNNGANLVRYDMLTETSTVRNIITALPSQSIANGSNTACFAGTNLYIFPTIRNTNVFIYNTLNDTFSNVLTPNLSYVSSVYDGKQYVYLTDATGNIARFNTTLDNFNDYSGYSSASNPFNVPSQLKTTRFGGNVNFVTSSNIYSWNVSTQTLRGNVLINTRSQPVISKQALNPGNAFVFADTTNVYVWITDSTVSNLVSVNLLDRTTSSTKTIVDITANRSNIYLSWSDNTLGVLNYGSNDVSGIYTIAPLSPVIPNTEIPLNMVEYGGNVYTLTSNQVLRINVSTFTTDSTTLSLVANNFKYTTVIDSNLYVFPSTGNVIARINDRFALSSREVTSTNVTNISSFVTVGNFLYCASTDSNILFQYDKTTSFTSSNFTTYSMNTPNANSFSSAHADANSNVYFLPYKCNSLCVYRTSTVNFQNTVAFSTFTTMTNFSNVVQSTNVGSTNYLISNNTAFDSSSNSAITSVDSSGNFSSLPTRISDKIKRKWKFKKEDSGQLGSNFTFYNFANTAVFNNFSFPTTTIEDRSDNQTPDQMTVLSGGNLILRLTWYIYAYRSGQLTLSATAIGSRTPTCHYTYISQTAGTVVSPATQTYNNSFIASHNRVEIFITGDYLEWTSNSQPVPGNIVRVGFMYSSISELLSRFSSNIPSLKVIFSEGDTDTLDRTKLKLELIDDRLVISTVGFRSSIVIWNITDLGIDSQSPDPSFNYRYFFRDTSYSSSKSASTDPFYRVPTSNTITVTQGMYQVVMYTNAAGTNPRVINSYRIDSDPIYYDYYYSDVNDYPQGYVENPLDVSIRSTQLNYYFNFNPLLFESLSNNFMTNSIGNIFVKFTPTGPQIINLENSSLFTPGTDSNPWNGRRIGSVFSVEQYLYLTSSRTAGSPTRDVILVYDTTTLASGSQPLVRIIGSGDGRFVTSMTNNGNFVYFLYQNTSQSEVQLVVYQIASSTLANKEFIWDPSRFASVRDSSLGFKMFDGVCFVQTGTNGSNLNAVNLSSDPITVSLGIDPQQFSCVITVSNFAYLIPSNGNILTRVDTSSFVSGLSTSITNFNIASAIGTLNVHTFKFNVEAAVGNNNIYLFARTLDGTNTSNILVFNTSGAGFGSPIRNIGPVSLTSFFNNNKILVPSSVDNRLLVYQVAGGENPYFEYRYPIQSVRSNVTFVHNNIAYLFPGDGSPSLNLVTFNLNTFSNTIFQHDTPVVDYIRVTENDYVTISRNKINVFTFSSQTGLLQSSSAVSFTNPTNQIVSKNYDGRYLSVFTGRTTVVFDFSNLSKQPITYTDAIGSGLASVFYNGNLYTANNLTEYYIYGTNPRSYYELQNPSQYFNTPPTGLITFTNNLYCMSSGLIYNIPENLTSRVPSTVGSIQNSICRDSNILTSNIIFLTDSNILSINVITSVQNWIISKPTEFSTQITNDTSNIYVHSQNSVRILRTNGTISNIADSSNIFETVSGTSFNAAFYDTSNIYYITNLNSMFRFNSLNAPFYVKSIPSLFANVYHSTLTQNKIYFLPGSNTVSNLIITYDTTQNIPFFTTSAYSNINLGSYYDIRSSVVTSDKLYGVGYFSANIVTINTLNDTVSTIYNLEPTVISNNYVSPIFDKRSFILTPQNSNNIVRRFIIPIITDKSFDSTIGTGIETNLRDFVQAGNTSYYISSSNIYAFDLETLGTASYSLQTSNIIARSSDITSALFDGRFLKYYSSNLSVVDVVPLVIPSTFRMSCIANYAFLSEKEKQWMASQKLQYPFTQLQTSKLKLEKLTGFYKLNFTNMVKEFILLVESGEIKNIELFLNGYSKSKLDSRYLSELGPYLYHDRTPDYKIYCYSLSSLEGGYLNMSRISEQIMFIETSTLSNLTIFALSDNILAIKDGIGGLVFGTRDR